MVSLFKANNSVGVFQLVALSVIVHMHFFVVPPTVILPVQSSLLYYVFAPLQNLPSLFISMLYHVCVILQSLMLNRLLIKYKLFPSTNYVTAMCYILLSAVFPAWSNLSEILVINFIIIFILNSFARLLNTQYPIQTIFNCGLLCSVCVILYPPIAGIILLGFISILIIRSFKLNEVICYFIGAMAPYYFLCGFLFLNNKFRQIEIFLPHITLHLSIPANKASFFVSLIIILAVILLGVVSLQNHIGKLIISARKLWIITVLLLVITIPSLLVSASTNWMLALFSTVIPASEISANLFNYGKSKFWLSLLFWLLVLTDIANSLGIENIIIHK